MNSNNPSLFYSLFFLLLALGVSQSLSAQKGTPSTTIVVNNFYAESFETLIPFGWFQPTTDDFNWTRGSGNTPSGQTGPSTGWFSTYYMYIEASHPRVQGDEAILISPIFDVSGMSFPRAVWFYHMIGSGMGDMLIDFSSDGGSSWTNIRQYNGAQPGGLWNGWHEDNFNIPIGSTQARFRIRGIRGANFRSDMAFDNFAIEEYSLPFKTSPLDEPLAGSEGAIQVYPNPFVSQLNLKAPAESGLLSIDLYDLQGKRIRSWERDAAGGEIRLDVPDLPAGTYILRTTGEGITQTDRIIHQ